MNIKSLEINLLKASEIEDGDIIIVKVSKDDKLKLTKENVQSLHKHISEITKKPNIPIYFFPKNISVEMIKTHVKTIETQRPNVEKSLNENENENTNSSNS